MNMKPYLVALGLASSLFMVGCDRNDNAADTNADINTTTENAANETEQAASNAANETEQAANNVGEKIDDGVITTKVKTALLADDTVKGLDINVDTLNGTVTLNGVVESQAQVDRAVQVAQGVEGVANVQNNLTVGNPS